MTTHVARWGNSLAVRLPRSVAAEASVGEGDRVDVSVEGGAIVVRPAARRYALDDLVGGITRRNRHRETDWGGAVGHETW